MRILLILCFLFGYALAAVNINTATKKELMTLDGIGSKKADAIIEYRTKSKFETIDDIKKVDGIGDKIFDSIKGSISVDGETSVETKKSKSKKE